MSSGEVKKEAPENPGQSNTNENGTSNENKNESKDIALKKNIEHKSMKNSQSSKSNDQIGHSPKKPVLKQMTLTEIAMNSSPKKKNDSSTSTINQKEPPKMPNVILDTSAVQTNNEIKTEKSNETKSENPNTENENNNKISFSKRNIVKILGANYDKDKQLIFAVQLKKPSKTVYVPYLDLKKRSPLILCDYFESLICFD